MDDLAVELGMSKKTFYALFASKVALVEAVMFDKGSSIEADLERLSLAPDKPFPVIMREVLACLQSHMAEVQPAFLRDLRRDAPEVFAKVETRRAAIITRCFTRLFNKGKKAGMIHADVQVKLVIEILLAATHAIINPQRMEELKLTPKSGFAAILKVILGGAMTDEGKALL